MSTLYGVYDISNHEQCVLITDRVKNIAEYLNLGESYIRHAITYNITVGRKYKVERLGKEEDVDNDDL